MNQDPTILDELFRLSQHVAALQKHTPFSVPQGYFDHFSESLSVKIRKKEVSEELASISALLGQMHKKTPYVLPDHFFDTSKFLKPEEQIKSAGKVIRFRQWFTYAAAASVIILVSLGILTKNDSTSELTSSTAITKEIPLEAISAEVYSEYLTEAENTELSATENIPQENTTTLLTEMSSSTVMELLEEIPETDIHTYMDQTNIDENTTTE